MENVSYKELIHVSLDEIARFITDLNGKKETNIGYCPLCCEGILKAIREDLDIDDFIIVGDDERITGLMGFDCDDGFAEVWGPFVAVNEEYDGIARLLWKRALAKEKITKYSFFINEENAKALAFMGEIEAQLKKIHYEMICLPRNFEAGNSVNRYSDECFGSFVELHDSIFEGSYYSGAEIVKMLDDDNVLIIDKASETEIDGYLFYTIDSEERQATIEYLAVREGKRNKGIGTDLLRNCIRRFYGGTIESVKLTVAAENEKAIRVYEESGFCKTRAYCHYIFEKGI